MFFSLCRVILRLSPSCGRTLPCKPDEALHVVDEIGQADLGGGAGDADGADKQSHRPLHSGKRMFDKGADLGAFAIGFGSPLRHRPAPGLLGVYVRDETVFGEPGLVLLRAIGAIRPYARGAIALAQQLRQLRPVIARRIGGLPFADQTMFPVDGDMVFVAEGGNGNVNRML